MQSGRVRVLELRVEETSSLRCPPCTGDEMKRSHSMLFPGGASALGGKGEGPAVCRAFLIERKWVSGGRRGGDLRDRHDDRRDLRGPSDLRASASPAGSGRSGGAASRRRRR